MEQPFFSIIIPTYNRADSMCQTLDSCWQQSDTDFEVLLVDDGSSDHTSEVAGKIKDPRLKYVRQDNAGPASARNRGMDMATGKYLAFLDSDDVWYADHLSNARKAINQGNSPFLYSQIIVDRGVDRYWVKPDRAMKADESIYDYLYVHGGFIQTSTMVVNRTYASKIRWDESVTYGDNDQFAIDLWTAGAVPTMLSKSQTLYADIMSSDALSQLPIFGGNSDKHTNFFKWMATQRNQMSEQAWLGFEAKHVSVSVAHQSPKQSLNLIWLAYKGKVFGIKGFFRQTLQTFAPRLYRRLTDQFVKFRGMPLGSIQD